MTLRASARAMAVGFAAFAVLCPERSSAEVVDVCKLSQQLAALFDKIGVIPSSHPQLRLYPNKGNRHPSENTAFLKFSKSGRAPPGSPTFASEADDRVAFMNEGEFVVRGKLGDISQSPKHPRTREFLSRMSNR